MGITQFLSDNRAGVVFTLIALILGTAGYFTYNKSGSAMGGVGVLPDMFEGLHLKVIWTDSGEPELIAHARNNAMARYAVTDGQPIPESGTLVLGSMEGAAMKKEGEYSKMGDRLEDFGLNLSVEGVLAPTNTVADRFHFLDAQAFDNVLAKSDVAYVQLTAQNTPKLFYTLAWDDQMLSNMSLESGNVSDYAIQNLAGEKYYPLIVGSDEAKVMQKEKLFSKTGDPIHGFFGKNVYVVGVLKPRGDGVDDMHFTPLAQNEWGNETRAETK